VRRCVVQALPRMVMAGPSRSRKCHAQACGGRCARDRPAPPWDRL